MKSDQFTLVHDERELKCRDNVNGIWVCNVDGFEFSLELPGGPNGASRAAVKDAARHFYEKYKAEGAIPPKPHKRRSAPMFRPKK